jgi:hypothetical protein
MNFIRSKENTYGISCDINNHAYLTDICVSFYLEKEYMGSMSKADEIALIE